MGEWWHAAGGRREGPSGEDELKRLLQRGAIAGDTLVWREGMERWVPLQSEPALAQLLNAVPPPVPPALPARAIRAAAPPAAAAPWPRFLARLLDTWIGAYAAAAAVLLPLLALPQDAAAWVAGSGVLALVPFLLLPLALALDAALYALCGNTLGKALLRIQVVDAAGERLGVRQYLRRNLSLWVSGLCLGIPFLSLFSMWRQSRRLGQGLPASYDVEGWQVLRRPAGFARGLLFALLFVALMFAHALFAMLADRLPRAGEPAPAGPASARAVASAPDASSFIPLSEEEAARYVVQGKAAAAPADCAVHYYGGHAPLIKNPKLARRSSSLCFHGADLKYSAITRTALWSAEHITPDKLARATALDFNPEVHAETRLPLVDRTGHDDFYLHDYVLVPLTPPTRLGTVKARTDSGSFASMVPLVGDDAARRWRDLGLLLAARARDSGGVYAISGALFEGERLTILNNRVLVPTSLYVAFYDPGQKVAGAYVLANSAGGRVEALPLAALEARAAIDLFPGLPAAVKAAHHRLPLP